MHCFGIRRLKTYCFPSALGFAWHSDEMNRKYFNKSICLLLMYVQILFAAFDLIVNYNVQQLFESDFS